MMPPAATTGTATASTTCGTSAIVPTSAASNGPANVPRWPPASLPCATTTSTPAASSRRASSTVVAVPRILIPRSFSAASAEGPGMPKVKLKTGGRASRTASSCAGNGSATGPGGTGAGSPRLRVIGGQHLHQGGRVGARRVLDAAGEQVDVEGPVGPPPDRGDGLEDLVRSHGRGAERAEGPGVRDGRDQGRCRGGRWPSAPG